MPELPPKSALTRLVRYRIRRAIQTFNHNRSTTNDKLPNDASGSKTREENHLETCSVLVACISF